MKKIITLFVLSVLISLKSFAAPGDTLVFQAMTYGSAQDTNLFFPTSGNSYYKILMLYTLKCNPAQNPACGEWDYLTYTHLYKKTGAKDSTVASIDTTFDVNQNILSIDTTWNVFWAEERFEIGRYITPYGNGLSLGNGFTWTFDVSDYRTLLQDSGRLVAGNWQELLDLKFLFIEGTPPREPYKVTNLWVGQPAYGTGTSIETFLSPKTVTIDANSVNTRLKMRTTGHGFGGTENCAEFCPKIHSILVDGTDRYARQLWRNNCGKNPVYPQGGTWVYDRSNWCPGAEVWTYDVELTPYVTPGQQAVLDYNIEDYTWDGQGSVPYYAIETQLVNYNAPNFTLDAAVDDIVRPSSTQIYKRLNPICDQPEIIIRNTGTTALTSATITYGITGGAAQTYNWSGNLAFLDTIHVTLPQIDWSAIGTNNYNFYATISNPNGGTDQYSYNNTAKSTFTPTLTLAESNFVIRLTTNNSGWQNSWELKNASGDVIASRNNCVNNTTYNDTVNLVAGCYTFLTYDLGGDGLSFWANPGDGNGAVRFYRLSGSVLRSFAGDFGSVVRFAFTAGTTLATDEQEAQPLEVFPNPSHGTLFIEIPDVFKGDAQIVVTSLTGQKVFEKTYPTHSNLLELNLDYLPSGMYMVNVVTQGRVYQSKALIAH